MRRKKNIVKSLNPSPLRHKAEEHLKVNKIKTETSFNDWDENKLLHELEVYQLELEMQNDELRAARDLTEKVMEKYTSLFDFSPAGYFVISREGTISQLNFMGANILGLDRSLLINRKFNQFLTIDTRNVFDAFLLKVFETKGKESCEVTLNKIDGYPIYINLQGSVNEDDKELLVIMFDITLRKRMERDLEISREKMNLALENGNIGVWEWDIETDKMIWDERMERIFNLEPGTFGQTYRAFENCINEEDLPHFRKAVNQSMELDIPFETIFRTKAVDGNSKYISTKALLNKDINGKPISQSGVCFDVTIMKKGTEQVLIKLNEELLRSNKDLEQFAYVASHDLQEPLRMVSSYTQMLAQRYGNKLDSDAREYIKFAVDGSKRMYDLINGLLAYSKVKANIKEFSEVNMNKVVEEVTNILNIKIREKNAIVKAKSLPTLFADESQMVLLVQNLITNSLKFTNESPVIIISAKTENNKYIFSIKDNGIGIESQYFNRIFQIFQRLVRHEEYEGTGIGLAICKRIVERHNGSIWVESEPEKGSIFYFTIPKNENN